MKVYLALLITIQISHDTAKATAIDRKHKSNNEVDNIFNDVIGTPYQEPDDDVIGTSYHEPDAYVIANENPMLESPYTGKEKDTAVSKELDVIGRIKDVTHNSPDVTGDIEADDSSYVLEVINGSNIQKGNLVDDVLSKFKNLKPPSHGEEWTDSTFRRALKDLGMFNIKGVSIVKVKSAEVVDMKKNKNRIKIEKAKKPRRKNKMTSSLSAGKSIVKRTNGYDLCTEYVDSMYVLAHDSGQLAYSVQSVRCEGNCYSATYGMGFGPCTLATKDMTVYVIDSKNEFVPQTISPGCACECLFTYN